MEAQTHRDLSDVIVVYVPEHTQIKRLMRRDGISEADARARVRSQMPIEEKKDLATIVIDNSGTRENTRKQTLEIFQHFKKQTQ
jgi:dephospho-CoA kinase